MFTKQELLRQLLPCMDAPVWWLGLSGGMDSMVLLDALVELRREHSLPPLHAIHIHHGLHPDADRWAEHCAHEAAVRQIPLVIERVQLASGASIEDQARDARYAAFARNMGVADILLLAHHSDDQVETLLFRLLRGTGLRGLAGMPAGRPLARGRLFRPLLDQSRSALLVWARRRELNWIEDPANQDPRFARTALRHKLIPMLRTDWPAVDANVLSLIIHVREANELLDERAAEDLLTLGAGVADPWLAAWPSLAVPQLLRLTVARRKNLLRYWLRAHACRLPQRRLQALDAQLFSADDSQPLIDFDDGRLHRSSGRLWLLRGADMTPVVGQPIEAQGETILCGDNGVLSVHLPGMAQAGLQDWSVAYRRGGEQIKLPGRPAQSLKNLFQEADIPTWLRSKIPLVYHAGDLVSVGGRWNASDYLLSTAGSGWHIRWQLRSRSGDQGAGNTGTSRADYS